MFSWRSIHKEDYSTLVDWWKWFRFPAPSYEMLSDKGFMITKNGVDICAGFLYTTNSSFCFCEYIVSNPDYRENDRSEAIVELINVIGQNAKELGHTLSFTFIKNENLINRYLDAGYIKGSESIEMVKAL